MLYGHTDYPVFSRERIRVQNINSRNYLYAYEDFLFSREIHFIYIVDYVDSITEEMSMYYLDMVRFVEEAYLWGDYDDMTNEGSYPIVYHWDLEDTELDTLFSLEYVDFLKSNLSSNYYYKSNDLFKSYSSLPTNAPMYDEEFNTFTYIADIGLDDFLDSIQTTHHSRHTVSFGMFNDELVPEQPVFPALFTKSIDAPNLMGYSLSDKLFNDSHFLGVTRLDPLFGLTSYAVTFDLSIFFNQIDKPINPTLVDIEYAPYKAVKFRRV